MVSNTRGKVGVGVVIFAFFLAIAGLIVTVTPQASILAPNTHTNIRFTDALIFATGTRVSLQYAAPVPSSIGTTIINNPTITVNGTKYPAIPYGVSTFSIGPITYSLDYMLPPNPTNMAAKLYLAAFVVAALAVPIFPNRKEGVTAALLVTAVLLFLVDITAVSVPTYSIHTAVLVNGSGTTNVPAVTLTHFNTYYTDFTGARVAKVHSFLATTTVYIAPEK